MNEQDRGITAYVDIDVPPPREVALLVFGTNQLAPAELATEWHAAGRAPLIIVTGGVNRHSGVVEGRVFRRFLIERGVDPVAIRFEDRSTNTWENVAFSLDHLREATAAGLPIAVVAKWYHLRAVYALLQHLPEDAAVYGLSWTPVYADRTVDRISWPDHPDGARRVRREYAEIRRRIQDGEFRQAVKTDAWRYQARSS